MGRKRTLTTGDIAEYCDVHYRTVIRWIEKGALKGYQLPNHGDRRVSISDFIVFLQEHEMPIPAELQKDMLRALIVEDEKPMARAIQRVLRKAGFETKIAAEGFEAGSLLESFSPTIMTLDLKMPGLSGVEVLKRVRSSRNHAQLKVLVISAMPQEQLDEALAAGADEVLGKPFQNKELLEKICTLMGVKTSGVVT